MGITQKGRSRTFLYDKGWYTIIIEFQPGSFAKGSYLNVGADLHFFPREHPAFSYGYRVEDLSEFENEEQWFRAVHRLCDRAIGEVRRIEHDLSDHRRAVGSLRQAFEGEPWQRYELGFLRALNGDPLRARWHLMRIAMSGAEHDVEQQRKSLAKEILGKLGHREELQHFLNDVIRRTRVAKGLQAP